MAQLAPPGVYTCPRDNDPYIWDGFLTIRHGCYQGGIFRFIIQIPKEYPTIRPTIHFTLPFPYHPDVDPASGEFNFENEFPVWKEGHHYVLNTLDHLRRVFYSVRNCVSHVGTAKSTRSRNVNWRAADDIKRNPDAFLAKATECVQLSIQASKQNIHEGLPLGFAGEGTRVGDHQNGLLNKFHELSDRLTATTLNSPQNNHKATDAYSSVPSVILNSQLGGTADESKNEFVHWFLNSFVSAVGGDENATDIDRRRGDAQMSARSGGNVSIPPITVRGE